jgi:predicted esterase
LLADYFVKRPIRILAAVLLTNLGVLAAAPIPLRTWTSTAGTKIEASAEKLSSGTVELKSADGRIMKVPIDKLVDADRKLLLEHFPEAKAEVPTSEPPANLPHPVGKIVENVEADATSHYHLYIPTTISADTPAPFLFYNGSSGFNSTKARDYITAAELTGMVVSGSVENGNSREGQLIANSTVACLTHLTKNLPLAEQRMFLTGGSGGGARTFVLAGNNGKLCAGAMPFIGYVPQQGKLSRDTYYFITGGATDYNRYASAIAAKEAGKNGIYRPYRGGHSNPPKDDDAFTEGLIWLYTMDLYNKRDDAAAEKKRFEARFLNYLKDDLKAQPWLAYFWTDHLLNTCNLSGSAAEPFRKLAGSLGSDPINVLYLKGRAELAELADSEYQIPGGSKKGHITDSITRKAEKIAAKYADVPEIGKIATEMGQITGK